MLMQRELLIPLQNVMPKVVDAMAVKRLIVIEWLYTEKEEVLYLRNDPNFMSRSRKKNPYFVDHPKGMKQYSSRLVRRCYRVVCKSVLPEYMEFPHRNSLINMYDVSDYRFYSPEFPKAYRK